MATVVDLQEGTATRTHHDDLDIVLEQYSARVRQVLQRRKQEQQERIVFLGEFAARAKDEWLKLLEGIAARLAAAGHSATVAIKEDDPLDGITLTVQPDCGLVSNQRCRIRVFPKEASMRVAFRIITAEPPSVSALDETYSLEELTPQRFNTVIIRELSQIFDSALPK